MYYIYIEKNGITACYTSEQAGKILYMKTPLESVAKRYTGIKV